jgi:hypothetical protein
MKALSVLCLSEISRNAVKGAIEYCSIFTEKLINT